ncbi:hypothetical protein [Clavibacter nebraskensis]|uniref:hypothetical protein n=1 Tax=Clavibacter nebraskensis TaxID=31963 RepID=UPI003F4B919B
MSLPPDGTPEWAERWDDFQRAEVHRETDPPGVPERASTSWSLPVPEGAYARVPAWWSKDEFLALAVARIHSEDGSAVRSTFTSWRTASAKKLEAVLRVLADAADYETGRCVTVTNATVATRVGCDVRTVQRASRILEALGLVVVLVPGRDLTKQERVEAKALHGGNQFGAGSVRAMTVSQDLARTRIVTLPSTRSSSSTSHPLKTSSRRASARPTAATRPMRRKNHPRTGTRPAPTRTLAFRRLAAELDAVDDAAARSGRIVGRFTQGRSIESLYRTLEAAHINESMTAAEILDVLRYHPGMRLRDGLAWLNGHAWIRAQIAFYRDRPTAPVDARPDAHSGASGDESKEAREARWARAKADADARRAAAAEARAEEARVRRRLRDEQEAIDAVLAQMRQDFAPRPARTHRRPELAANARTAPSPLTHSASRAVEACGA